MAEAETLKVGDTVRLKSGGPVMTITSIGRMYETSPTIYAWCTWFKSDNESTTQHFPPEALMLVKEK